MHLCLAKPPKGSAVSYGDHPYTRLMDEMAHTYCGRNRREIKSRVAMSAVMTWESDRLLFDWICQPCSLEHEHDSH